MRRQWLRKSHFLPPCILSETVLVAIPHKLSMARRGQDKDNGLLVFIPHLNDPVSTIAPPYTSRRPIKCHLNEVYLLRNRTSSLPHQRSQI